ncbi:DUF262 domain-containing protein [Pirellulaceae bacterium SH449]
MAKINSEKRKITEADKKLAEEQIVQHHRTVDYDTREYPVEVIVAKYLEGLDDDSNEIFVPDYQRDHTWEPRRQSRFIESVLIGLPIPYLFVADIAEREGRLEIVDGSQRIRTLADFLTNDLVLEQLDKLTHLNGFRFKDLPQSRQRRFKRHTLRLIELTEKANEEIRRDLFERINTGSQELNDMEKRWGAKDGNFLRFVRRCSENELFHKLAPLSDAAVKRRERQEFVLRFFAYLDRYEQFDRKVNDFLNGYLDDMEKTFNDDVEQKLKADWESMLYFIDKNSTSGFSKKSGHLRTPRVRFETLSVGTALALAKKPDLQVSGMDWINDESDEFHKMATSGSSNSKPKIKKRLEYVRDRLLKESLK